MAGVFGQSLYACGGRVAGLRLRPFSPHHALMLMELQSPYIMGGAVTLGDTTAALIACQSTKSDGMAGVMRLHSSRLVWLRWRLRWLFRSHAKAMVALEDYIGASMRAPEMWIDSECKGKRSGAPWPYYIVSVIAQEMPSIPYAELWDMPLTELACHKAIIDERTGGADIAERDLQRLREIKGETNG